MSPQEHSRFLKALEDDQEFREEVRQRLLTKELLALPEQFAKFSVHVTAFIERTEAFMENQSASNARTETAIQRLQTDVGILKGNAARRLLRDHIDEVLEFLNVDFVRMLVRGDLTSMVRNSGEASKIPFGERQSFYSADLVVEATSPEGNTCYIAGEASYTADLRDTSRALRNAEFLTTFTGHPAVPIRQLGQRPRRAGTGGTGGSPLVPTGPART